jgi:hypothetical protein
VIIIRVNKLKSEINGGEIRIRNIGLGNLKRDRLG